MLAGRVERLGFSPTLGVAALARRLTEEGQEILDLSVGEPDFPTPQAVKEAGRRAIAEDRTRYTATEGIAPLRQAIAERLRRDRGLAYAPEQILVSPGAKFSLYLACLALLERGDAALIPAPYWSSYPEQVGLADAEAILVACPESEGFKLTPERLRAAATPRTRLLVLNTPSNPTGVCYERSELEALGRTCLELGLWIIADEIYARLLFDGAHFASIAQHGPELRARTLIVDGMSKAWAMTGWRIGWAAGPAEVITAMAKLQSHTVSHVTSITQWAGVAALELDGQELAQQVNELERRRDAVLDALAEVPGVTCVRPQGAFYAFPNVSALYRGDIDGGQAIARYLLERARVAVVPGEAFGAPSHVRLSYAVPAPRLREALDRLVPALRALA